MAQHEVLILNESVPQIQAPQAGDTYTFPRTIEQTADLTIKLGDNAGANKLSILDSNDVEVARINSDGWITLEASETYPVTLKSNAGAFVVSGTQGADVSIGDTAASVSSLSLYDSGLAWPRNAATGVTIGRTARSNDSATQNITLKGDAAYASAVTNQDGGNVNIKLGDSASGGGDVGKFQILDPADAVEVSFGESGEIVFNNLPTSDPSNAGQLWNDSGTLKVSAG